VKTRAQAEGLLASLHIAFAAKVARAPESPGVYLLKDARGHVL